MDSVGVLPKLRLMATPHSQMEPAKTVVVPVPAEAMGGKKSDPVLYANTGVRHIDKGDKPVAAFVTRHPLADERPMGQVVVSKGPDGRLQVTNDHGDTFRTVAMPLIPSEHVARRGAVGEFFAKIWDIMTGNVGR